MGNLPGGVNRFTLANLFNEQWEILEARFIYDGILRDQGGSVLSHVPLMKGLRICHRILMAL